MQYVGPWKWYSPRFRVLPAIGGFRFRDVKFRFVVYLTSIYLLFFVLCFFLGGGVGSTDIHRKTGAVWGQTGFRFQWEAVPVQKLLGAPG